MTDGRAASASAGQDPAEDRTGTTWLTEAQQHAWRNFAEGHQQLYAQLDKEVRDGHGLSLNEYEVLVRLSEQENRTARMAELADDIGLSRSRLTHIVARMEKRGLVHRCPVTSDGRGVICRMTHEGWELLRTAAPLHVHGVREHLIDLLDESEVAALDSIFTKVNNHIREVR